MKWKKKKRIKEKSSTGLFQGYKQQELLTVDALKIESAGGFGVDTDLASVAGHIDAVAHGTGNGIGQSGSQREYHGVGIEVTTRGLQDDARGPTAGLDEGSGTGIGALGLWIPEHVGLVLDDFVL